MSLLQTPQPLQRSAPLQQQAQPQTQGQASLSKRKRDDDGGASAAAAPASSLSLLMHTPRVPRPLLGSGTPAAAAAASSAAVAASPFSSQQHHLAQQPAPLLSMPSPSSELLPVLAWRAQRQSAIDGGGVAGTPMAGSGSSLLLRSQSNTQGGQLSLHHASAGAGSGSSSTALLASSASAQALISAAASQARQSEHALSLERERSLRLQVEELRAENRALLSDREESQIKAGARASREEAAKVARDAEIDALKAQLRFLHEQESEASSKVREQQAQINALESNARNERAQLVRLRAQVATHSSSPARAAAAASSGSSDEDAGRIQHLDSLVKLQAANLTELESQLSSAQARAEELEGVEHALRLAEHQRTHAEQRAQQLEAQVASQARESEQLATLQKRAAEFVDANTRLAALTAENARLHASRQNFALQHEQQLAASAKIHRLELERAAQAATALENQALREKLAEWEKSMQSLGIDGAGSDSKEADEEDTSMAAASDSSVSGSPASKRRKTTLTPHPFLASYHQLQASNLTLSARAASLELQYARANKENVENASRVSELSAKLSAHEESLATAKRDLVVQSRRIDLLQKERDGLQKVLDAYDSEDSKVILPPGRAGAAAAAAAAAEEDAEAVEQQKALKARIKFLEEVIKELESQLSKYRGDLGLKPLTASDAPTEPLPSVVKLLGQIAHLRKELAHLEPIASDLSSKVEWINAHYPALLDTQYGGLRVQSLPGNPSHAKLDHKYLAQIKAKEQENKILAMQVDEAKQDVDKLTKRLAEATAASAATAAANASGAAAPMSDAPAPPAPSSSAGAAIAPSALLALETAHASRVSALESEKLVLEKRAQRLKEVFSAKVAEFRNTCYLLTGFKIELITPPAGGAVKPGAALYRLKNMYAEAENDHLLFQQSAAPASSSSSSGGADASGNPTPARDSKSAAAPPILSVLETDFTQTLDAHTTNYLQKQHSIPGFLAAVTLQLLEKQTKVR